MASFFAAFMSTIDTQLNWGSSLVVNDILRRFLWKGRKDREYMAAARIAVLALALAGALASFAVEDISVAWKLIISVTAGIGSVYIARWYWWRVNAWSEISAMATAALATAVFAFLSSRDAAASSPLLEFPFSTAITVAAVIPVWVSVTLLTRPVDEETLSAFYGRVRPGGPGWRRIRRMRGEEGREGSPRATALAVISGMVFLTATLTGTGGLILGRPLRAAVLLTIAAGAGTVMWAAAGKAMRKVARED